MLRFCVLVTKTSVRLIRMQESLICSTIFEALYIVVARQTSMNFFQLFVSGRKTDIKRINVFKSTNLRCLCKSCQHSILVPVFTMSFRDEFQIGFQVPKNFAFELSAPPMVGGCFNVVRNILTSSNFANSFHNFC